MIMIMIMAINIENIMIKYLMIFYQIQYNLINIYFILLMNDFYGYLLQNFVVLFIFEFK